MIRVRISSRPLRVLDFDCEARATGYGDPNWVPQEITCIAWSWLGEKKVESRCRIDPGGARRMLEDFRRVWDRAEMVTGHNIRRYDLPVLNADYIRAGLPPLDSKLTHDTLRDVVRTKGLKRDQENLCKLYGMSEKKQHMAWQDWQEAYAETGWPLVRSRCETDVLGHKKMRREQINRGWSKPGRMWNP